MRTRNAGVTAFFAVIAALILTLGLVLGGCTSNFDTTLKEGNLTKVDSLQVASDGKFKIMQLTDLHLTTGGSYKMDHQTLQWVEQAIETVKPDLVEVTGDAVGSGVKGRNEGILALANIFEKHQTYWAYTFGNHDGEHSTKDGKDFWIGKEGKQTDLTQVANTALVGNSLAGGISTIRSEETEKIFYGDNTSGNEELFDLLKGYEYSLLSRSQEELQAENRDEMGVGNYVIELKNNENKTVFAVFHMDTHGKTYVIPKGAQGKEDWKDTGYVGLTQKQVNWYENKIKSYSENGVKSALFMHVPSYEYRGLCESYIGLNRYGVPQYQENADLEYWGQLATPAAFKDAYRYEFKDGGVYAARWDDGLAQVMAKYPSNTLIAVGHDHNNSFVNESTVNRGDYYLAYGRTSGVNAWSRDIKIGASVYTIDTNAAQRSEATLEQIYSIDIAWPNFKYEPKGNR